MGGACLSLNLRLLNLFLGMCKGVAGLPPDLHRLGFRERAIELTFQNANNDAVVPELIIASRAVHHSILFEWKEGANTEADQLRRYSGVTQADLTQRAMLAADECGAHDVSIIGLEQFRERIARGVDDGGYPFPVLMVTDAGLELIRNAFSVAATDRAFRPALNFDWNRVPTSFFPVDGDSDAWEYAEQILPYLLTQMETGATRIQANDVARKIIPLWDTANTNFRERVEQRLSRFWTTLLATISNVTFAAIVG